MGRRVSMSTLHWLGLQESTLPIQPHMITAYRCALLHPPVHTPLLDVRALFQQQVDDGQVSVTGSEDEGRITAVIGLVERRTLVDMLLDPAGGGGGRPWRSWLHHACIPTWT